MTLTCAQKFVQLQMKAILPFNMHLFENAYDKLFEY